MTEKKVMKLASRGKRLGAACIDSIIPAIAYAVYASVLGVNSNNQFPPGYGFGDGFGYGYGYGYDFGFGYGQGLDRLSGAAAVLVGMVSLLLIAYVVVEFVFYAKGKSIGKAILGMQVVSSTDGKPFRFWKMVFRECIVKAASGSAFGLGYIWVLIDEKNRSWHDKILDSYVVDLKESQKLSIRKDTSDTDEIIKRIENAGIRRDDPKPAEPEVKPVEPEVKAAEPEVIDVTETASAAEVSDEPVVVELSEEAVEAAKTEDVPEEAEAEAESNDEAEGEAEEPLPELSMSMKKEDLLQAARERGVQVSSRATKAAIIEAVEKAKSEE